MHRLHDGDTLSLIVPNQAIFPTYRSSNRSRTCSTVSASAQYARISTAISVSA
jgi:hypothetical protein